MLETERLILRPWTEDDAEALYKYASDERVGPPAGWPPHTSVQNSLWVIRNVLSKEGTYAVVLKETGEPVGSAGIMLPGQGSAEMSENEAEIGYWIGASYWGRGLIPEAAQELLRRCFEELNRTAVWAYYFEGNAQSRRVMEKCGMKDCGVMKDVGCAIEGLIRDAHRMRITREEWEARKGKAI